MDPVIKEAKLTYLARSVLLNKRYRKELKQLMEILGISELNAIKEYLEYDMDVSKHSQEMYRKISLRMVFHMHNLLEGSWHQDRQNTVMSMIREIDPATAVDIGFGVPPRYVREIVLKKKRPKLTLVDLFDSAFEFSEALLGIWSKNWKDTITFKKSDMDALEYVGDFDLYIIKDTLQNASDPTAYLKKTVEMSPSHSKFIILIPLGPRLPTHHIKWKDRQTANDWLAECGLSVDESKKIYVNPYIDLFAEDIKEEFCSVIFKCSKK